jgi:hypothetical protein
MLFEKSNHLELKRIYDPFSIDPLCPVQSQTFLAPLAIRLDERSRASRDRLLSYLDYGPSFAEAKQDSSRETNDLSPETAEAGALI